MCAPSHVGGSLIICEGGGGGEDARKMKCGRFFVVIGFEDFMFKRWLDDLDRLMLIIVSIKSFYK